MIRKGLLIMIEGGIILRNRMNNHEVININMHYFKNHGY
jgi:hypothetical protein